MKMELAWTIFWSVSLALVIFGRSGNSCQCNDSRDNTIELLLTIIVAMFIAFKIW